jgi:alpha-D-xyloside xylohydrolase
VLERYTALTGRPALPPAWSFGLWLTTSFTTNYDEATVTSFIDGMAERDLPLHVFHFDCFWMKEFHWCDFEWDERCFPDPAGHAGAAEGARAEDLRVDQPLYRAALVPVRRGHAGRLPGQERPTASVWQWDRGRPGMGLVDFTNPAPARWYAGKLRALVEMGVDCFKTDFGERIPTDVVYFDGSDPVRMHNYYSFLYNQVVFRAAGRKAGEGRGGRLRPLGHGRRAAVPGALGRRQHRHL